MKNHKRDKKNIRSALSGKIINGREVILTEEAIDYVKNMGYIVINNTGNLLDFIDSLTIKFIKGEI